MSDGSDGYDVRSLAVTFRSGAVLAYHRHPWGQLIYATSGVMRVATPTMAWLIPATKAIWIPAGVEHEIEMRGETALRTLYIAVSRSPALPETPVALEVAPLLKEMILYILGIGMLDPHRSEQDRLAGVLMDLLISARPQDLALPLPQDRRAVALALRLQARPDDGRNLMALAQEVGASLRTLQRTFPRETGLTIEAWRQKARLLHSLAALSSGASVTTAALDCGYRSVGAFIMAFSQHFGTTPGRYSGG